MILAKFFFFLFILFILINLYFIKLSPILADETFFDDFSGDLNNWEKDPIGWSIETIEGNNALVATASGTSVLKQAYIKNKNGWKNYVITAKMRAESGVDSSIIFRVKNSNSYYIFTLRFPEVGHSIPTNVVFGKKVNGANTSIYMKDRTLVDNHWYAVKVIAYDNNLKMFLENEAVAIFDYTDNAVDKLDNGSVGFAGWSGALNHFKFYYDDIRVEPINASPSPSPSLSPSPSPTPTPTPTTPTPTPTPLPPVLLLPGLGGSWNLGALVGGTSAQNWTKPPFVDVYENFRNTMLALGNGYVKGTNYDEYYYDWRKKVDDYSITNPDNITNQFQVKDLKDKIDLYYDSTGQKIDLVGHSLGGVLARAYAQRYGTAKINKIVTIGSPHSGSVKAYTAWEGAEIVDYERVTWADIAFDAVLRANQASHLYKSRVTTLHSLYLSVRDLIPTFDFLKYNFNLIKPAGSISARNNFLFDLNAGLADNVKNSLITIAGIENDPDYDTLEWLNLGERAEWHKLLGYWQDGWPIERLYSTAGDLAVLAKSAKIADAFKTEQLAGTHDEIMSNSQGITKILNALDLNFSPVVKNTPKPQKFLFFWIHSPANLVITGPTLSCGYGIIPDNQKCFYSADDGIVGINEADLGQYEISLIPIGSGGPYQLDIGQITQKGSFWQTLAGNIANNPQTYMINFDPLNPLPLPLVDPQGETSLDQAFYLLGQLDKYIKDSSTPDLSKKNIQTRIKEILKNLTAAKNNLTKGKYGQATTNVQLALAQLYGLRLECDKLVGKGKLDNNLRFGIKSQQSEIAKLLNFTFVKIKEAGNLKTLKSVVQIQLATNNLLNQSLAKKLKTYNQNNDNLGLTLSLAQEMQNMGQTAFDKGNLHESYINNFGALFLLAEAEKLL